MKEGEGAVAAAESTARAPVGCPAVHEMLMKEGAEEGAEDVVVVAAAAPTFAVGRRNDGGAVSLLAPFPPSIQVCVGGHMPWICLSSMQPTGTFPLNSKPTWAPFSTFKDHQSVDDVFFPN